MSAPEPRPWELIGELRSAFDASFAAPILAEAPAGERFLSIRAGGEALALPLAAASSQISGLAVDRTIVPVPSSIPEFLGLVAVGGMLIPAFDLASLAGLTRGGLRWSVLLRRAASAALVFESMDGFFEALSNDLRPVAANDLRASQPGLVTRLARRDDQLLPILDLDALGDVIQRRAGFREPR